MICALLLGTALLGPYNYSGKLIDFLPEGSTWGMPASGLPMQIVISSGGSKVGPASFSLKGPKWTSEAKADLQNLAYANGTISGNVHFKNTSGFALDAVRFDVASATERYKDKDGTEKTRSLEVKEESPILLGDLRKEDEFEGADFKATGIAWKPETIEITVTAKLSGLTYQRSMFDDHQNSNLEFDSKGRLLLGSGMRAGLYRADLEKETLDMVTSTPEQGVVPASNPVDGTLAVTWSNGHVFNLYTPGGDQKSTIEEGEPDGMQGWPSMARYDGKGNLYLGFGQTVAQFTGNKPNFVLKSCGQFEFGGYVKFDVTKDGAIIVASEKNIFKFDPGGKNGRVFVKGPDDKLGRIHDYSAIRLDPSGYLWVAEPGYDTFVNRISVFDSNGKFVWVFGRGGPSQLEGGGYYDGQVVTSTSSIAVSPDGRVYIAGYEGGKSVLEFVEF